MNGLIRDHDLFADLKSGRKFKEFEIREIMTGFLNQVRGGAKLFVVSGESDCYVWGELHTSIESAIVGGGEIFFLGGPMITQCENGFSVAEISKDFESFHLYVPAVREAFHGFLLISDDSGDASLVLSAHHAPFNHRWMRLYESTTFEGSDRICKFLYNYKYSVDKGVDKYVDIDRDDAEKFVDFLYKNNIDYDYLTYRQIEDLFGKYKENYEDHEFAIREIPHRHKNADIEGIITPIINSLC